MVGSGEEGGGNCLKWNKCVLVSWFLGVWFLGFKVSWFLLCLFHSFLVSEFQNFKDLPSFHFISCFLGDIDLISKVFKILVDGLLVFFFTVFSNMLYTLDFPNSDVYRNNLFKQMTASSWIFWGILGSPKGKVQKYRNHRNEGSRFLL